MRRRLPGLLLIPTIALASATMASPAAAAPPTFSPSGSPGGATVRPTEIHGGSDFGWEQMRWSSWTATGARGKGRYYRVCKYDKGCRRTVVKRYYPVTVRLSRPISCGGGKAFSRFAVRFGTKAPSGAKYLRRIDYVCGDDGTTLTYAQ